MKKLTLTTSLAAALTGLTGCANESSDWVAASDTEICVDRFGSRIDDDYCDDDGPRSGSFLYLRKGSPIPFYYDNVRSAKYARYISTTRPSGFVDRAPAGTRMARSTAVSRGGLGSSGSRFGRGG